MSILNTLVEDTKIVTGLAPITPSSSTPDYVTMKNYRRLAVIITVNNGATVTGSAITLKQATDASGTSEKALGFDYVWVNTDTDASDTLTKTAVSSDTFTTDDTNNKNLKYVIEVDVSSLDTNNNFNFVRLGTGDGTNMSLNAEYILYNGRYKEDVPPTAIA